MHGQLFVAILVFFNKARSGRRVMIATKSKEVIYAKELTPKKLEKLRKSHG